MITETHWHYDLSGCSIHDKPALAENEIEIQVPFIGTYGALSDLIDSEMECEADEWGECEPDGVLHGTFFMGDYLNAYVSWLADFCGIKSLKFREMTSPKYYNFETDSVWCSVDKNELWNLYKEKLDYGEYTHAVLKWTTPVSGYHPHFRSDDFHHESLEDMAKSPACVLGVIVDTLCQSELYETVEDYDADMVQHWELTYLFHEQHHYCEYLEVSAIEAE